MHTFIKYSFATLVAAALTATASAQISPRPAAWSSAGGDGLNQFTQQLNLSQQNVLNAEGLNLANDGTAPLPAGFVVGQPTLSLNPNGSLVNVIFIGETAGWQNDFGFVRNPDTANLAAPASYNPLVVNIDSSPIGTAGTPGNGFLLNGTFTSINYGAGEKLDFFLNGAGGGGAEGGTWFTFGTPNQFSGTDLGIHTQYKYINLDDISTAAYDPVATLVVAYEDSRRSALDADYSDVIIAFQGVGSAPPPAVPEPATYGLIGAAALVGLVALRRNKRKTA